ncbi:hypothetical protein AMAG_14671 [Allomyces macrogynus ATCC 38327]|uniref:BZIP domain-containing protein n=1 Tax=Allomyces macrogynus (strain ATCC 38327) TaxID=578462 RepID=A0A0L0T7M3_ALLM3|nr:hypothetical protein AMAG_14671 [Allomyces macrogynus ATCC 38327]|eukprot:KNE70549.1 hypothetical protein AMAG_14671 [Allomyces macrogynus ATCC 38327]
MQAQDINAAMPFATATSSAAGFDASSQLDALFKECFPEYASIMDTDLVMAAADLGLAQTGAPAADAAPNGAYASISAGGATWFPPADVNLRELFLPALPPTSLPTVDEEDETMDGLPDLDQVPAAMDEDVAYVVAHPIGQQSSFAGPAPVAPQHVLAMPEALAPAAAATVPATARATAAPTASQFLNTNTRKTKTSCPLLPPQLPYPEKMIARDAPINPPRGAKKRSHTQMTEAELAQMPPEERKAYEKRRNNTISARESRARKQAKVDHLEKTSTKLLARCAALEQELALYKAKYGPLMQ